MIISTNFKSFYKCIKLRKATVITSTRKLKGIYKIMSESLFSDIEYN